MLSEIRMRSGAWHGDREFTLTLPSDWDAMAWWPRTPPPLTDTEMAQALDQPVGQPPLRQMCGGKSRPIVIVDDLNRPTPAARVLPLVLAQLKDAGIPRENVTVLVATGMHGRPQLNGVIRKIGASAVSCRVLVHDPTCHLAKIGRTSLGTPVLVNRELVTTDFVIGIGGVYPNYTAGFGGGSKLVLGVLGLRSIAHLHYSHQSMGWGSSAGENSFRKDLDEIARMVGLKSTVTVHINAERQVVRLVCGDQFLYYPAEVEFCRAAFAAPPPRDADAVISNAYPNDATLTFARMKGFAPLRQCRAGASRIAIAACREGLGYHGLFPFLNAPRFHSFRKAYRMLSIRGPREFSGKILAQFHRKEPQSPTWPIWLYRPGSPAEPLRRKIPGMKVTSSWPDVVEAVRREQAGKRNLKVVIYPCAAMQYLDDRSVIVQEKICVPLESSAQRTT